MLAAKMSKSISVSFSYEEKNYLEMARHHMMMFVIDCVADDGLLSESYRVRAKNGSIDIDTVYCRIMKVATENNVVYEVNTHSRAKNSYIFTITRSYKGVK